MKKLYTFLILMVCISLTGNAQINVSGSTGADGTYTTLKAAFDALNLNTTQTGNNINIDVNGNTTETASASLNVPSGGAWSTFKIAPTGGPWTIGGALTAGNPLVILNGADNVIVNGNGNLIFSNTTVSATAGTVVLKLVGDATNNTFNNTSFLCSSTGAVGTNTGAVWLSTGTTTGNDNNSFQSCKFGPASVNLPSQLFINNGSTTSAAIANSNITINNCEFYDYFSAASSQAAIYNSSTGATQWTITNNKIYQTAPRTITTSSTVYGIYFTSTSYGDQMNISGNTIGYASNAGTGTMIYNAGTTAGEFTGIKFSLQATSTNSSNINNNIISDIQWTSTSTSIFNGIYNSQTGAGATNPININNNTVRNINFVTSTGIMMGIEGGSGGPLTVNGNNVNNLIRTGVGSLYGINYLVATNLFITNNTISNLSVNAAAATNSIVFAGIYGAALSVNETISGNSVRNFNTTATGNLFFNGIYSTGTTSGVKRYMNNIVSNFSNNTLTGQMEGIRISSGAASVNISNNTIDSFSSTSAAKLEGVFATGACIKDSIYNNNIFNFSLATTSSTAIVNGLSFTLTSGTHHVYNNFVSDLKNTNINLNNSVFGINIGNNANYNILNNTIYLGSSGQLTSTGALYGGAGIYTSSLTGVLIIKNNIININALANGDSYFAPLKRVSGTNMLIPANITANNNIYYNNGGYIYGEGLTLSSATNVYYDSTVTLTGTIDTIFNTPCGIYKNFMSETNTYWENNWHC